MQTLFSSWFPTIGECSKNDKKLQLGEKSHPEYSWNTEYISDIKSVPDSDETSTISGEIKEEEEETMPESIKTLVQLEIVQNQLVQLNFQLIRGVDVSNIRMQIKTVLQNICSLDKVAHLTYLSFFYRLIGYTRDIVGGKGEYELSYMCLLELYNFFPILSMYGLSTFVVLPTMGEEKGEGEDLEKSSSHPYGSYKDLKYFAHYILENTDEKKKHPLYKCILKLMSEAIRQDALMPLTAKISLAAKWMPRESSKFCYMFNDIAIIYFEEYFKYCKTPEQKKSATNKAKMDLRKLISSLNKRLDTTQIKQCANTWADINPNNITSITFQKQKKALLNKKKGEENKVRYGNNLDRIQCAENITNFIYKAKTGEVVLKGKRVSIANFVKEAIDLNPETQQVEVDALNFQWKDNATQNINLGNMFPVIDVSGSMTSDDSLYYAIGLGLRIALKSRIGPMAMTFSDNPTLINLEGIPEDDFVAQVKFTQKAGWGGSTNLYKVFELFLKTAKKTGMTKEDIENMSIVILSDMQINCADRNAIDKDALFKNIQRMYFESGEYNPPHLVFWNLRATSGFPAQCDDTRCSMLSGFSPAILNAFMNGESLKDLPTVTPWKTLLEQLNNSRYDILECRVRM